MSKKPKTLDEDVFKGIFPMILRLVQKRRLQSLAVDHDDLVQEGALGLVQSFRRFAPGRKVKLSTFAYRRIDGNIRDAQEREINHGEYVTAVEDDQLQMQAADGAVEADEIRMQLYDKMIYALENDLPDEQAVILVMHFFDGKTLDVIARELKIAPSNVKRMYSAALSRLKKAITKA